MYHPDYGRYHPPPLITEYGMRYHPHKMGDIKSNTSQSCGGSCGHTHDMNNVEYVERHKVNAKSIITRCQLLPGLCGIPNLGCMPAITGGHGSYHPLKIRTFKTQNSY